MSDPFQNSSQVNAVIKVRRGPEVDRTTIIPADGELVYSTNKKRLFVGDGVNDNGTQGGNIVGNKAWVTDNFTNLSYIEKYDTVYNTTTNGFYVLTGDNSTLDSSYALVGGKQLVNDNVNPPSNYTLPKAETNVLGGVMVREGLSAIDGRLFVDYNPSTMELVGNKISAKSQSVSPVYASYSQNGGVKIVENTGLVVTDGNLSLATDSNTIKLSSIGGVNKIYADASVLSGQMLSVLSGTYIEDPATKSNGQILSYNGTTWVAANSNSKIKPLLKENILYPNVTNNIIYNSLVEAGTLPTAAAIAAANANVYAVGMYKKLSNGNWIVPDSVRKIRVFSVGGNGGSGSGSSCTEGSNGGGGGGGGGISIRDITLTTGDTYTVTNGTNGGTGVGGTSSSFSGNGVTITGSGGSAGSNGGGGGCWTGAGGGAGGAGGTASGGQVNATGTSGTRGGTQSGTTGTSGSIPNLGTSEIGTGVTILILELNDVAQTVSY